MLEYGAEERSNSHYTIISSKSPRSSGSDSWESACTAGIGSLTLTLVRLFRAEDSVGAAGIGPDGSQPSNMDESRACEKLPLQSPDFRGELVGDWVTDTWAFAVPSPSSDSSSSSDSCKSAKRLIVASEGVKEPEDNVLVLLLRYHSSGTQIW